MCRQKWVKVKNLFEPAVLGKKAKPERQIRIVCAPTGSGKSTCFGRQVYEDYGTGTPTPTPNGKTALIITARRSHADSFVQRFPGFVHYKDVDWEEQSRMDTSPPRLIIQYESLHKLHMSSRVYQEIFCDEHRSLAAQAVSVDTNRKNLKLNLQVARRLMARQSETTTRLMFSDSDALLDPVGEWFVEAVADRGFREDTRVVEFRCSFADGLWMVWPLCGGPLGERRSRAGSTSRSSCAFPSTRRCALYAGSCCISSTRKTCFCIRGTTAATQTRWRT